MHEALPPSEHREKLAQQPATAQSQIGLSTNTEWQSERASHAASVVTLAHDASMIGQA
jgi:hypothetical protein